MVPENTNVTWLTARLATFNNAMIFAMNLYSDLFSRMRICLVSADGVKVSIEKPVVVVIPQVVTRRVSTIGT